MASDFRDSAVAASQKALAEAGATADPLQGGFSYCLPARPDAGRIRAGLKAAVLGGFLLGIAMVLGGMFLAGTGLPEAKPEAQAPPPPAWKLPAGVALGVSGGLLVLCLGWLERALVRRVMRREMPEAWQIGLRPRIVRIEDANTYNRLKLIPEDHGLVLVHVEAQCVEIEGLTHRYLVHRADLIALKLFRAGLPQAVELSYRAAGEPVELMLIAFGFTLYEDLVPALVPPPSLAS